MSGKLIGLIDVDAFYLKEPKFPNLALMRISAYHKAQGDTVEWWWTDMIHYDIVYMSKVFSDAYSKPVPPPQILTRSSKAARDTPSTLGKTERNTSTRRITKPFRMRSNICFRTTPSIPCLTLLFP